jgi:hypothetical protein
MSIAAKHSTLALTGWILLAVVGVAVLAALIGRFLIRRGLREPLVVRMINRTSDRVVEAVKRPVTLAVLDEVASVLQAGHYTRNIASALQENRDEIKAMIAEKIKEDPTAGRINYLPFHDRLLEQASETTLRVLFEVLADPRTDELFADLLRDNLNQIRQAVRESGD